MTEAELNGKQFWLAVEKAKTFIAIYPQANFPNRYAEIEQKNPAHEDAIVDMIKGWLLHLGPITAKELSSHLDLPLNEVDQVLLKLEATGLILRGSFRDTNTEQIEWCERRLLARIHRLTVGRLRKEIEPVSAAQFMRWLLKWQHLAPKTQLRGEQGLLEIIRQLQGFEIPANAWEREILAKRLIEYDRSLLDRLCLMGAVGWGRLSPHPATLSDTDDNEMHDKKRVRATSIAPITFFIRGESDWISDFNRFAQDENIAGLSHEATAVYVYLKQRGASFFADIVRGVGRLQSEVEAGLWELVAAGLITADSFDNLRALIDPRRRTDAKRRRMQLRYSSGRWSLLHTDEPIETAQHIEAICWMLLKRYGVVFRDLVAREKNIPRWRELLVAFRRLEDRGEIRGGRFVSGFLGEQFALPYAVDSLRTIKKQEPNGEEVAISAADPLNLVGIILPGNKISAISGERVILRDGVYSTK